MDKNFDDKVKELSEKYNLDKPKKVKKNQAAEGYMLGVGFVVHVLVGLFLGIAIDKFTGTAPLFLLIFLFLGFIAGFRNIYKAMK
tara:strand:+ start:1037 stop:1291 length:255 start_codon:yes stop_codon:yes gene_type:complete